MRIIVFDYSGHPFQVQLARALADRGHDVMHVFSSAFQTPKGNLERTSSDSVKFQTKPIATEKPFAKQRFFRRRIQEIEIGRKLAETIVDWEPDVVISSNAPLDVQRHAHKATLGSGAQFIFWLQDIYSRAMREILPKKIPFLGELIANHYTRLEFDMLRRSHAVVAITKDFVPLLVDKDVNPKRISVIENWAPLDQIPNLARDNDWAVTNLATTGIRIVYSGTIGYKHNPNLLLSLARVLPEAHVHVFSEGPIVDRLAKSAQSQGLINFSVAPWVPFKNLPDMLAGADIVVALIEAEAGIYSVPSKVLTYLASGRAILASVPYVNLAARTILHVGAGFVAAPGDEKGFVNAAIDLARDPELRTKMGAAGRAYAERVFDIDAITDQFTSLISNLQVL